MTSVLPVGAEYDDATLDRAAEVAELLYGDRRLTTDEWRACCVAVLETEREWSWYSRVVSLVIAPPRHPAAVRRYQRKLKTLATACRAAGLSREETQQVLFEMTDRDFADAWSFANWLRWRCEPERNSSKVREPLPRRYR